MKFHNIFFCITVLEPLNYLAVITGTWSNNSVIFVVTPGSKFDFNNATAPTIKTPPNTAAPIWRCIQYLSMGSVWLYSKQNEQ